MHLSRQANLTLAQMPTQWYNIFPDLPEPLPPPKDPEQGESRLADLPNLMIGECLKQESSKDRWVDIPGELIDLYAQAGRPRPLFRARNLEKKLNTPARLYYKGEFFSPTGSHKVNTAIAQCYYAKKEGFKRVTTETGAGQWGTALAYGAALLGLKCTIFWVRSVYNWKADRRTFMELLGAEVIASPSPRTASGRQLYEKNPNHPGSLGIAISEGLEESKNDPSAVYCLGSVLNHVLLHQTIIGLETKKQFEIFDDYPDIMISCFGGGSNFGGFILPFVGDVLTKGKKIKFIAAQSRVATNLQGEYRYDFADYAEFTPLLKMYTLGHKIDMKPIKADGLRYHGGAPIISLLRHLGYIDTVAYPEDEKYVFERAKMFIETEGWLPAPESAYSIACAIDEAIKCREAGESKVIAFNISGHGFMDIFAYREVLGL
ncbi:MAG TPA: TrpB-like pyridoxal phosphate-dependent enzyme [bacterium (Candidatus Stahlbacteria)]|nr:TrpB-like pyridoxal phosphate-dependent enzyme [Candidatus Stahlbacteria bacterium]